jgi:hypothetical protein
MKKTLRIATLAIAAGLLAAPAALFAQGPPPPPGYGQGYGPGGGQGPRGWDAPPDRFTRDLERNAFHDGMVGAQHDLENRRRPNVNNRDEFRNYRGPERRAYRDAFSAGYRAFWDHQGPGRRY